MHLSATRGSRNLMEPTDSVEEAIEFQRRHRHGGGTGGKKSGLDRVGLLMEAG